tara:strand:+ start:1161 stop:2582 length:1422 start_codon:yes stop_codon:yes gene_type:complete
MLLTEISKHIKCNKIYGLDKKEVNFNYITSNSKKVRVSSIFAISNKTRFFKKYTQEAISKGAVGIITDKYIGNFLITQFVVSNIDQSTYKLLSILKPRKPKKTIALTGTNGKTSVVWFISQICSLNQVPNKTYGTLGYYINSQKKNNSTLTTPEFEELYQTAYSRKKNIYNYIFEVSSHSLVQDRLKTFPINVAALTNITQDHLDYHKSFKNYKKAKYKLFIKKLNVDGYAILNDNLNNIKNLKNKLKDKKIITYGKNSSDINLFIKNKILNLKFFEKKYSINLNKFSNIELQNLSCAIACCFCININIKKITNSLKKITSPPGRFEKVNKDYNIYIDYAHTPDALKKVLISKTINNNKPNLIFGCGGNRDKEKRSKMGIIANKYANKVYITDDNPRNEDPKKIRKSILMKCKKGIEIADRKKAIEIGIKELNKEETLIIAGKGHEKIQIINNSFKKFSDLNIAKKAIRKIYE